MKTLRRLVMEYYVDVEVLYKRLFDETLLRCLDETEAKKNTPGSSRKDLCNSC